jgi:Arc/MetJ-type ribon-helix-helix transcriptional regulator
MKRESESRAVNLPTELYKRIKDRAKATNFESVDEYVIFVLSEVLKGDDEHEESAIDSEQEEVKKRLKALGYLD